ncbi:MAG: hypothetical protein KDI88_13170 [Gammaproteobacteria bacterium]|nr:hypothetical protein [Gammaproteobacteria bacterium]
MGSKTLSLGLTLGVALVGLGGLQFSPEAAAANGWGTYPVPAKRFYFRPVGQRMNRSPVASARWRPQPGLSAPRYSYPQATAYTSEVSPYRPRPIPSAESAPETGRSSPSAAAPQRAFRPGRGESKLDESRSIPAVTAQAQVHQQFRPAAQVRKPSYEEMQARASFRSRPASVYGNYARNTAVAPVYYGTHWRTW